MRVTALEQKVLRAYYGAENVTFTRAGLFSDSFDVAVSEAGFRHIAEYVRKTGGSSQYAERLNRAILDPFWRYDSLGAVATRHSEWIGQQYENELVPQEMEPCDWHAGSGQPGHCRVGTFRDPPVVSSPGDASGSTNWRGFIVPTKPYSRTPEAILDSVMPQVLLTALTVIIPGPEDDLLASRAATVRVAPAATGRVASRLLSAEVRVAANLERSAVQAAVPHGLASAEAFSQFGARLNAGLAEAGYADASALLQGSAVTGRSFRTGTPFDVGRVSDFDVALASPKLLARARELGVGLRSAGTRTGPLSAAQVQQLGLGPLQQSLSQMAGRPVNFMVYGDPATAAARAPSIPIP